MPQFWIAIFFILLAIAQLYQSLQEIDLPLPVYLVLGTALAVASNAQRKFSFSQDRQDPRQQLQQPPTISSLPAVNAIVTDRHD